MIFRLYTVYSKNEMIKLAKPEKNIHYRRKCSNNFTADCRHNLVDINRVAVGSKIIREREIISSKKHLLITIL